MPKDPEETGKKAGNIKVPSILLQSPSFHRLGAAMMILHHYRLRHYQK